MIAAGLAVGVVLLAVSYLSVAAGWWLGRTPDEYVPPVDVDVRVAARLAEMTPDGPDQ